MLKNPFPSHPGEILKKIYLEQLNLNQLAEKIGCAHRRVNEIINGKRGISPEFALDLEAALVSIKHLYRLSTLPDQAQPSVIIW